MTIRQRGSSYQVDVRVRGQRLQRQADSLQLAQQLELELIAELQRQAPSKDSSKPWTLEEAFNRTWDRIWKDSKSARTARICGLLVLDHFGKTTQLDTIDSNDVDAWVEHLGKEGNSNGTINRKLAALSKMMTVAQQRGGMKSKPHLQRQTEAQGRIRWLTQHEEDTMINLLHSWGKADHADAFIVLLDTGMRCGELYRIRSQDLSLDSGMVAVWQNKADLPRSIPMTSRVRSILTKRSSVASTNSYLFPYDNGWFRNQWDRLKSVMNLSHDDQLVPHCLRHTCASRLVQRGMSIVKVQKWLGHKTIQITLRYAHLAPADLLEGATLLERQQPVANPPSTPSVPTPQLAVTSPVTTS